MQSAGEVRHYETLAIDQEIVALSGKKNPRVLFIPTTSNDSETYSQAIEKLYGKKLGCKVEKLFLLRENPSQKEIEEKIFSADIIYIGGGNTLKMMKRWRRLKVDQMLQTAYNQGVVLCGASAGSICWFEHGHSDSMSFYHPDNWKYIRVKGLGMIKGLHCPHFDGETLGLKRKKSFAQMVQKIGGIGIAIDNHAAIVFRNDSFRVINSKKESKAYKLFKRKNRVVIVPIEAQKEYSPLETLYSKSI
ncbi:Type 1 glutamine amidotransferase-like domain-containing protein [Candidatus Peregrinibacteria bacterium]|nr:MAG: Type 1 glutamine amidotransferase-like domain-containing protein [Candidatus Peregrinibacteria bacterium]